MRNLSNIRDFDSYIEYHSLNESLTDGSQSVCNKAFINGGIITFADGTSVHPKEIVNAVNEALTYLADQYARTFKFGNRLNIIYLAHSTKFKTMAVDQYMNLYMNAGFIFHTLKMDKHLIAAVIMHEVLHVLFNHIERGKNWLGAKGKSITNATWNDNNLAADVEVNQTLVRLGIIDENNLINTIHGMYLLNLEDDQRGSRTNVIPMEIILDNEKYMNKLRSKHPAEPDPETTPKENIDTTEEWDKGYKSAWNKLAKLTKKYGYKKVWDKLIESGIINGAGELNTEKDIDDIKALEYKQVKSMDEYLNESLKVDGKGQTYDDGYMTAVSKIINSLKSAMNPSNDSTGGGGGQSGGKKYNTGVDKNDLEELDIPSQNNGGGEGDDDGLPENVKPSQGKNDEKNNDSNDGSGSGKGENNQGGKGGSGKSDEDITDDDLNKLADDLKKRVQGQGNENEQSSGNGEKESDNKSNKNSGNGSGKGSNDKSGKEFVGDPGAIGGTGSFIDGTGKDDILKDAGYNQEDIDAINEVRERNKEKNSPKGIEKARQDMRNKLTKSDYLGKLLSAIDVESSKYKNVWKEIMEDFLAKKTRRAGTQINDTSINWKRKSRIALGQVGPQYLKVDQDPQDVNIYVDVSGSMDLGLLEIICKSLVIFTQEYEYSGINVCPWASVSNGIYKVDDFKERGENEITEEILKIVSKGSSQCGGGTESKAVLSAMVDCVVASLESEDKEQKDDVHVVITDGQFDFQNIENKMMGAIKSEIDRSDVAELAPEHTFWMIYDASDFLQESWKKEIKKGKLIFINSETVKNNK